MNIQHKIYQLFLKHPKVITDSRKIEEGCLFFALKGANFNGNEFAAEAIQKGASFAIIDEIQYEKNEQFLLVKDVLKSLQQLARDYRRDFDIPLLAITGSNGKTTTKELIAGVIGSHYKTHSTKGNFNNQIGLPLTILSAPKDSEMIILEMGANHIGEIKLLCEIAEPSHGLITNIGKAHLEGFGDIEGVKKGKGELYDFLATNNNMAFVNMDEPFLTDLAVSIRKKLFYTQSESPNPSTIPFEVKFNGANPYVNLTFLSEKKELVSAQSNLIGKYNFNNLMTAVVIGKYFKVPSHKMISFIENYRPKNNRSQIIVADNRTIILDAYNANPTSMTQALDNFNAIEADKKIAILGDMFELGKDAGEEHQHIVEYAEKYNFSELYVIGKHFSACRLASAQSYDDVASFKANFNIEKIEKSHILIKGSRGMKLESIIE